MRDLMTEPGLADTSPGRDVELARQSGDALAHFDAADPGTADGRTLHLRLEDRRTGARVEADVPGAVVRLLADALAQMAAGKAATLMPVEAELSVQQAADRMGVSRPYLLQLLERGEISFHTMDGQRRVRTTDLAIYLASYRQAAHASLDDLAAEAQRLNLYE